MQRRTWLKLGLASAVGLALVGGGLALQRPALSAGRLLPAGRAIFEAVGAAVLEGCLPEGGPARQVALQGLLARLDDTLAGLPAATQAELAQLLALLASAPGRWALAGLSSDWREASVPEVQAALQGMRMSHISLRQQAYFGLRDLSAAAYFADPGTWGLLGYPGPSDI
jgi:hypothetical protein